jgi:hypothetical protein
VRERKLSLAWLGSFFFNKGENLSFTFTFPVTLMREGLHGLVFHCQPDGHQALFTQVNFVKISYPTDEVEATAWSQGKLLENVPIDR